MEESRIDMPRSRKAVRRRVAVALSLVLAIVAVLVAYGVWETTADPDQRDAAAGGTTAQAEDSDGGWTSVGDHEAQAVPEVSQWTEQSTQAAQEAAEAVSSVVVPQLDALFAGAEYAVKVVDLADRTVPVSVNENEIYASASTYKLYVAHSMLSALDAGTVTWDSALNGTTLRECFALMIEISDNDCAQAWMDNVVPRDEVNALAASIGATSTRFAKDEVTTTTAADLATILTGIYDGTLMSASSNEVLIDALESQIYRDGIPAGIGESGVVADKVGFLYGYLNDAGIVYSDKGDYVFVILTNNSSWAAIAEATAIIYDALPA
ncbi:serine hydrolase [Bifidobacterium lemurum]|uniref:Serine hydrolase n=2 Tax=Bifidobacterium lemurum TaxID=1603886 RepID=A0A261FP84_9BIFI|nr:serine hydrolase [Bifidobacterium lemurum]